MNKTIFAIPCIILLMFPMPDGFAEDATGRSIRVEKINAEIVDSTKERVCIRLSEAIPPRVRALPGERPRVFMDIEDVVDYGVPSKIEVGGKMILRVRSHWYRDKQRLRIVLDLDPSGDYFVEQTLVTSGKIFCLETYSKADE